MVAAVTNLSELQALAAKSPGSPLVAHFWASWAPMCTQTTALTEKLAADCKNVIFASVEAEEAEDISTKFGIESVPAFVFIKGGEKVGGVVGANAPEITSQVMALNAGGGAAAPGPSPAAVPAAPAPTKAFAAGGAAQPAEDLDTRLGKLINQAPIMLFMKGSPGEEKCGFSRKTVELLRSEGITFSSFDILEDNEVREGLKTYSNWPTYPQLYAKGQLVGGLDIIKELQEGGELKEELGIEDAAALNERLGKLINQAPVMLFMKGSPGAEQCGFSRKIVELLNSNGVKFGSFDILGDESVRQGLKTYSNWPTYPQVYKDGALLGGLDILKELEEAGELKSELGLE